MGQFGNQPDFATFDVKSITVANGFINDTPSSASFLGSSVIYIGDNTGTDLKVYTSWKRRAKCYKRFFFTWIYWVWRDWICKRCCGCNNRRQWSGFNR